MNKDISLMIELQKYWDSVLQERNISTKNQASIVRINNDIKIKSKETNDLEDEIKNLKIKVNQNEVGLSEAEDHLKKLEIKKDAVKTEKEVNAVEHEFIKARSDKEKFEENLISLYDKIEAKEKLYVSIKTELDELGKKSATDIAELDKTIIKSQNLEKENKQKFEDKVPELSPNIKSRFLKFINSQNGKGIARIEGEICGACNFQIPFNLIQDLSKDNNIVTCTNCGRYIYKN